MASLSLAEGNAAQLLLAVLRCRLWSAVYFPRSWLFLEVYVPSSLSWSSFEMFVAA